MRSDWGHCIEGRDPSGGGGWKQPVKCNRVSDHVAWRLFVPALETAWSKFFWSRTTHSPQNPAH